MNFNYNNGYCKRIFLSSKRSQVWVETAIYTLIGLTIIAIILSAAVPQIDKTKDKGVIKQTITALDILNDKIIETEQSPGSIRIVNFRMSKGRLEINSKNNTLIYILEDTRFELSQPGEEIAEGNVIIRTEEHGSRFNVFLKMDYNSRLNITYSGEDNKNMVLHPGTTPYRIQVENIGDQNSNDNTHIDLDLL